MSHSDVYDFLLIWPNFNHAEGSAHITIKNGIRGIHMGIHDDSAQTGTSKLEAFSFFRNYMGFPTDVNARIPGNNDTTMSLIAQEVAHRWGAYVHFDSNPGSGVQDSDDLLGRGLAHWCYFANVPAITGGAHASSLEGNSWQDNTNGTFSIMNTLGTGGYSDLDQYLMGFRLPTLVTGTFTFQAGGGTSLSCPSTPYTPETDGPPITVSGTRTEVAITDVIRVEGARIPDATQSPRNFRMAFVLLARSTASATQESIDRLDGIRIAWGPYFEQETDPNSVDVFTQLGPVDMDEDGFDTVTDCDDNNASISPVAPEFCNHIDDDCDGFVDEGFDADGDLWTTCNGDCDDSNDQISPNATEILGNGIDDDCDGEVDNPTPVDNDDDGYPPPVDCDDSDPSRNPGAVEMVDGVDNNCNGFLDCYDPQVFTESEAGARSTDGFDNDCNGIIDG